MAENIDKQLKTIIENITEKTYDDLSGKNLFEDLEFDSILIMDLITEIEEEFSIFLGEEELIEMVSEFDNLLGLIKNKLNESHYV